MFIYYAILILVVFLLEILSIICSELSAVDHFSQKKEESNCSIKCDNNVSTRQCHPLPIPHAHHKRSIILILLYFVSIHQNFAEHNKT